MANGKNKPPKSNSDGSSGPTRIALWTQIVITIGGIAAAAIAAYQAIRITQIQAGQGAPTATVVFLSTPLHPEVATGTPTSVNTDTPAPTTYTPTPVMPIHRIDFDYQDSPTQRGWEIRDVSPEKVNIEHIHDSFVGNAISISSLDKYAMDYEVKSPEAQGGKVIELVANLTQDAHVFTYLSLVRDDGSSTQGWLKFTIREGPPKPVAEDEWQLTIEPVSSKGGDWFLYRIDLEDAVMQTFGNDAWNLQQLEKFRLRGNLSLDYIHIYITAP